MGEWFVNIAEVLTGSLGEHDNTILSTGVNNRSAER